MTESDFASDPTHRPATQSMGSCLLLLFATLGGYGLLTILALVIVRQPTWQLSLLDAAYWGVALLIPFAQVVALPTTGKEPGKASAPRSPLVQLAVLALIAGVVWATAHSVYLA